MNYLFSEIEIILNRLRNRNLFLFLDFDGTLAPIARTPQEALICPETKALLVCLAKNHKLRVSIISGRALQDINHMVAIKDIVYAGNHGMEIQGPRYKFKYPLPADYWRGLKRLKDILRRDLAQVEGLLFEDKGYGLCVHYRDTSADKLPQLGDYFRQAGPLFSQNHVRLHSGKKVFELRPSLNWDKGKTVMWLLHLENLINPDKNLYPVYIGDDQTDEDAFESLKNHGLTVVVEQKAVSAAQYYVQDTYEVTRFLTQIADLKE